LADWEERKGFFSERNSTFEDGFALAASIARLKDIARNKCSKLRVIARLDRAIQ